MGVLVSVHMLVIHTLMSTLGYRGPFLPGFSSQHKVESHTNEASDTIGEVTLCVSSGQTLDTIRGGMRGSSA